MKRVLAERAAETFVLASAEKLGAASRFGILPLDGVSGIIADLAGDDPLAAQLRSAGARVIPTHP